MTGPDWERLTPSQRLAYEQATMNVEIKQMERHSNLETLKIVKQLKRSILRDAELNSIIPEGIEQLDSMTETLLGRLT